MLLKSVNPLSGLTSHLRWLHAEGFGSLQWAGRELHVCKLACLEPGPPWTPSDAACHDRMHCRGTGPASLAYYAWHAKGSVYTSTASTHVLTLVSSSGLQSCWQRAPCVCSHCSRGTTWAVASALLDGPPNMLFSLCVNSACQTVLHLSQHASGRLCLKHSSIACDTVMCCA